MSVDHIFPKLTRQTVGSTPQKTNKKEVLADLKSGNGINLIENKQMRELITEDQKLSVLQPVEVADTAVR